MPDDSPSVRNLVKNFEHTLSPLSPRTPSKSWSSRTGFSPTTPTLDRSVSNRKKKDDVVHGVKRDEVFDDISPKEIKLKVASSSSASDRSIPKSRTCTPPIDNIAHNRKMLIDGLKFHLSKEHSRDDNMETMQTLPSSPIPLFLERKIEDSMHDTCSKYKSKEEDAAPFTISRSSIHSMQSPSHTPSNTDAESIMTGIVTHCHSVESKFTPMRQRRELSTTTIDSIPSVTEDQTEEIERRTPSILRHHHEKNISTIDNTSTTINYRCKDEGKTSIMKQRHEIVTRDQRDEEQGRMERSIQSKPNAPRKKTKHCIKPIFQMISTVYTWVSIFGVKLVHSVIKMYRGIAKNTKVELMRVPSATRTTIKCLVEGIQWSSMFAILSLIVSMASNIYPTVPRCNIGLSLMILFYKSIKVRQTAFEMNIALSFFLSLTLRGRSNKVSSFIVQ